MSIETSLMMGGSTGRVGAPSVADYVYTTTHDIAAGHYGIEFSPDGTRFYSVSYENSSTDVRQYLLGTAYDLTTAQLDFNYSRSWNTAEDYTIAGGIQFSDDGNYVFLGCYNTDTIYRVPLTVPYDMSSAGTHDAVLNFVGAAGGHAVIDQGRQVVVTPRSQTIYHYTMSTPYDLATVGTVSSVDYGVLFPDMLENFHGIHFTDDGFYFYAGTRSNTVTRFELASPFDVFNPVAFEQREFTDTTISSFSLAFNSTLTRMFVGHGIGTNRNVYEFSL